MTFSKSRWKRKPGADASFKPRSTPVKARKKQPAALPTHKFIQAAQVKKAETGPKPGRAYIELGLDPRLQLNILEKGYLHTTPIQDQAIEPIRDGQDVLGIAQTGTGKTAAFLIPLMEQWLLAPDRGPALVLTPTRELALQVEAEFRSLSKGLRLFSATFIGGGNVDADVRKLSRFHHLIVATPGRLLDLMQRKAIDLRPFKALILDEFDRMLDMGFVNDVNKISGQMTAREQTLLFSATIEPAIQQHIDRLLRNPITIKVSSGEKSADHIEQDVVRVAPGQDKVELLENLLHQEGMDKVLVFAETKYKVDRLTTKLIRAGFKADRIHGNKSQSQRQRALEAFRSGRIRILVATDVAARGLDIDHVTHVINFEPPKTYDSYIHRIGRTGRAGRDGKAFTFVDAS
jgi:ATP-dependent RNA helicase RhlE